ncbi:MAG: adenylosuccinate synthetase [Pseudomonadota bacterium]
MPISVIVGGQFGSEGKGKVSAHLARELSASAVIRVGGPNSGHTAIAGDGKTCVFRQLPAGLVQSEAVCVLPAGSLIDVGILLEEVERFGLSPETLWIDPRASIVTDKHKQSEGGLAQAIGSTASGTGASLTERLSRNGSHLMARDIEALRPYIRDGLARRLRQMLSANQRVIVEGTQGFGLSVWHSQDYPFATSRDTIAASFVAESGLAPHDVDDCVMVLRTFPIRVGGNSGPLPNEIDWETLAREAELPTGYHERTSATGKVRRIGRFESGIVVDATAANSPHRIVLNHMDYVDPSWKRSGPSKLSREFILQVEREIGRRVNLIGYGPDTLVRRAEIIFSEAA